jgi:hypothetical protein
MASRNGQFQLDKSLVAQASRLCWRVLAPAATFLSLIFGGARQMPAGHYYPAGPQRSGGSNPLANKLVWEKGKGPKLWNG